MQWDQKVQEFKTYITRSLVSGNVKHEVHDFDSGCCMIDVWKNDKFYCIQLQDDCIGLSLVGDDDDFSTIPDERYYDFEEFNQRLNEILAN